MLNELVASRPSQPYSWLARRMRRDKSEADTPAVGTLPLLDAKVGAKAFGGAVEKAWGYTLAQSGGGAVAAAPAAPASSSKGLQLTIEPFGKGVLLAIRPGK